MSELRLDRVQFQFDARTILEDFSLRIGNGDFVTLLGPSGCGKSTLLRLLAGLLPPTRGTIQRPSGKISFVFQDPRLLPWRTVRENIELPFILRGQQPPQTKEILERVGLAKAQDLFPHQLSGGMKQRAAIARALLTDPDLLLMDEPFSALDESIREDLEDLLREIWQKRRMTLVFVTHSIAEAVFLGERILLMGRQGGNILLDLRPELGARTMETRTSPALNECARQLSRALHTSVREGQERSFA